WFARLRLMAPTSGSRTRPVQVTDRIFIVGSGRFGFGLTHHSDSHVYLVDGGSEIALIDAGAGVETGGIVDRVVRTRLARDRVRKLFVTHAHADHAGGARKLRASFSLDVHASSDVARILRAGDETAASVDVGKAQGTY